MDEWTKFGKAMSLSEFQHIFSADSNFDRQYPDQIRALSYVHWTPIEVALKALDWLDLKGNDHVLDIGSGVGKFCIVAGHSSNAQFTGVELRQEFVDISILLAQKLEVRNVQFICSDINQIDFTQHTAFYYYNPFCELLSEKVLIDNQLTFSREKHRAYEDYVFDQLNKMPLGTKMVMYCSPQFIMPPDYDLKELYFEGTLTLWERTR